MPGEQQVAVAIASSLPQRSPRWPPGGAAGSPPLTASWTRERVRRRTSWSAFHRPGTSPRRSGSGPRWSRLVNAARPTRPPRRRRSRPPRRRLRPRPGGIPEALAHRDAGAVPDASSRHHARRGEFQGPTSSISARGSASLIELEPGRYHLRLEDFSVRNGPDLYVYLSTAAHLADDLLELGRLKATDGRSIRPPSGHRIRRFGARSSGANSSAICSRSPRSEVRAEAVHPLLERVPSRSQTPRHGCGQKRSSTHSDSSHG